MLSYVTEIDVKKKEIRVKFLGETNTFFFDDVKFPLEEALKVATEFVVNQLKGFLQKLLDHAAKLETPEFAAELLARAKQVQKEAHAKHD